MNFRHATGALLIFIASVLPALGQTRSTPSRVTYGIAGTVRDDSDQHAMDNIRVDLRGRHALHKFHFHSRER